MGYLSLFKKKNTFTKHSKDLFCFVMCGVDCVVWWETELNSIHFKISINVENLKVSKSLPYALHMTFHLSSTSVLPLFPAACFLSWVKKLQTWPLWLMCCRSCLVSFREQRHLEMDDFCVSVTRPRPQDHPHQWETKILVFKKGYNMKRLGQNVFEAGVLYGLYMVWPASRLCSTTAEKSLNNNQGH